MSKYRLHFFVCVNNRPPFAKPSCGPAGSPQLLTKLQEEVQQRGLSEEVAVTACSCLGPCESGPMMVVYPEGVWYAGVRVEDVSEIVDSHVMQRQPVQRLRYDWTAQSEQ